jgi:hypothetical protein
MRKLKSNFQTVAINGAAEWPGSSRLRFQLFSRSLPRFRRHQGSHCGFLLDFTHYGSVFCSGNA